MTNLFETYDSLVKQAAETVCLYVFVPRKAINSVKLKGLLAPIKLIKDTAALNVARSNPNKYKAEVESKLEDSEWDWVVSSISAFFTLPDWSKLKDNHNIFKFDAVPVQINLSKLLEDKPDIKFTGVELEKYNAKKLEQPNREKSISFKEIKEYVKMTPRELWKHYDNSIKGMYSPDVPHVMIQIDKISPKYLIL